MKSFSTVICAAVCAVMLVGAIPVVSAQTPLELVKAYEAERDKLEQNVQARFEAMVATLETEIQAKRITPEAAQGVKRQFDQRRRELRWLKSYESSSAESDAVATTPLLDKSKGDFDTALKTRDVFRTEKLKQVRDSVIQAILSTWRKAEREEDLNEAMELQREAERVLPPVETAAQAPGASPAALPWRISETASEPLSAPTAVIFKELSYLLSTSQQFLSAIGRDDPDLIRNTRNQLRPLGDSQWARIVTQPEIDKWRMRFTDKAVAEVIALRAQADNLIAKGATSAELQPIAKKLWPATLRMEALGGRAGKNSEKDVLSAWIKTLERIESHDWENVQSAINATGGAWEWLSAEGQKGFYGKLRAADKGRAADGKKARIETERQIRERLTKVADEASALVFADELSIEQSDEEDESIRERLAALQSDLRRLATQWNAQPSAPTSSDFLHEPGTTHPWQADLRLLRNRLLRERVAQTSNSPELLASPLDALPLDAAIRNLCTTVKEKQDWQRLYGLLVNARSGSAGRDSEQNDELRGVKAFLAGRNFERAEQYGDAVQSYRTVLSCIGKLVPAEAAAERLKAITREHPDAVSAATPSGASPQPALRKVDEAVR